MPSLRQLRRWIALLLVLLVALPAGVPELKLCVAGGLCTGCGEEAPASAELADVPCAPRDSATTEPCCAAAERSSAEEEERPASSPSRDCTHCCLALSDPSFAARGNPYPSRETPAVDIAPDFRLDLRPADPAQFAAPPLLPATQSSRPPAESRAPPSPLFV
ncbi:MAG: hypothetical protein U0527_06125 [Candidatus Eisenbacteria bacterium]